MDNKLNKICDLLNIIFVKLFISLSTNFTVSTISIIGIVLK